MNVHDAVNSPSHYTSDPSGIECITITRHRNFSIGNTIKYLWRAGLKDSPDAFAKQIEDLEKARWYIADEIKRLTEIHEASCAPKNQKLYANGGYTGARGNGLFSGQVHPALSARGTFLASLLQPGDTLTSTTKVTPLDNRD